MSLIFDAKVPSSINKTELLKKLEDSHTVTNKH